MPWPNISANGTLSPFTTAQRSALRLQTADIREGDHPTFELDSQGCSVRRMWFCDWAQRDNAIAYLLGASSVVRSGAAAADPPESLSRIMPQAFPDAGYSQYVAMAVESCKGARSAGINDVLGVPAYDSAKLIVRYEQVFFGLGTDAEYGGSASPTEYNRYTERLPSTSTTSYLGIPGSMMVYRTESGASPGGASPVTIPYNVGKPETLTNIAFKWRRIPKSAWGTGTPLYKRVYGDPGNTTVYVPPGVPAPPAGYGWVVGSPYIGTVNRTEFLGYPPGQLLFDGVDEEVVPDPVSGEHCWNLTLKWIVKACQGGPPNAPEQYGGHNYLYYGGKGGNVSIADNNPGYYLATRAGFWVYPGHIFDGACMFNERDHSNLFKVGVVADANV